MGQPLDFDSNSSQVKQYELIVLVWKRSKLILFNSMLGLTYLGMHFKYDTISLTRLLDHSMSLRPFQPGLWRVSPEAAS